MATLATLLPTMGEKTTFRGFSMGIVNSENKDDKTGQIKNAAHYHVMCGTKLAKIKIDPTKQDVAAFPPAGFFVQVSCDRGEFNNKPFYNNPATPTVLLNPDGSDPARAAR